MEGRNEAQLRNRISILISKNRYEWGVSYLATVTSDLVVVPLDKELSKDELAQLVKNSEVSAIMFTKKYLETFKEIKVMNIKIK